MNNNESTTKLQNFTDIRLELDPNKILFTHYKKEKIVEVFKTIKDYSDYQVSNFGRVKSLNRKVKYSSSGIKTVKERILKANINKGYFRVVLHKNKKKKSMTIHQLVAVEFLNHTICGHKIVVDHEDNIKTNNFSWNLNLVTSRENSNLKHIKSSSKYVGVYWHKTHKKWASLITFNGSKMHLGYFIEEKEADIYYKNALNCVLEGRFKDIKYKHKQYSSKYKGVSWAKHINKWRASVKINKKSINIGSFSKEHDAYVAYKQYLEKINNQLP